MVEYEVPVEEYGAVEELLLDETVESSVGESTNDLIH